MRPTIPLSAQVRSFDSTLIAVGCALASAVHVPARAGSPAPEGTFKVSKQKKCKLLFEEFKGLQAGSRLSILPPEGEEGETPEVPVVIEGVNRKVGAVGWIEPRDACPDVLGREAILVSSPPPKEVREVREGREGRERVRDESGSPSAEERSESADTLGPEVSNDAQAARGKDSERLKQGRWARVLLGLQGGYALANLKSSDGTFKGKASGPTGEMSLTWMGVSSSPTSWQLQLLAGAERMNLRFEPDAVAEGGDESEGSGDAGLTSHLELLRLGLSPALRFRRCGEHNVSCRLGLTVQGALGRLEQRAGSASGAAEATEVNQTIDLQGIAAGMDAGFDVRFARRWEWYTNVSFVLGDLSPRGLPDGVPSRSLRTGAWRFQTGPAFSFSD